MGDKPNSSAGSDPAPPRPPELDLELWKHFAGMGGIDKNTMITIESILLPIVATATGYILTGTQMFAPQAQGLAHAGRMMVVALLGAVVSAIGAYLALLYGGYANRNWAKADEIARRHDWLDLLPDAAPQPTTPKHGGKPGLLARFAWQRARPCWPETTLAPVFKWYFRLALAALVAHVGFFLWSAFEIAVL